MTSTVRYGLKLAVRPSTLLGPPLHLLRRPSFPCIARRAYRLHSTLHNSAFEPTPKNDYTKDIAAEAMDIAPESQETVSSHASIDAEPEAVPSQPSPAVLKPGDSFGSDFYGELNGFSLESAEADETAKPVEAATPQDEAGEQESASDGEETEPPFELSFKRKPLPPPVGPTEIPMEIPPSQWSHLLYQGPDGQDVTVDYCHTFEKSESVAQNFLNEPVLGLDMEWHPYPSIYSIKENASVLQLACEDRIAIFHLSLHEGTTPAAILPPSLKTIIESDKILKAGVSINIADGSRLRKYLKLEPKGLFELSHLYHLIANKRTAGGYILRSLKRLNDQAIDKLGLPLDKGTVRTSDWTKPLSQAQIHYAAADAYAGFMLFHVMNEERKQLKPTPPIPGFAELGLPIVGAGEEKEPDADDPSDSARTVRGPRAQDELHGESLLLYEALCSKRTEMAAAKGVKSYQIASNEALAGVAITQPRTVDSLRQIKGLGDATVRNFGAECMFIVERFLQGERNLVAGADNIPNDVIIDDPILSTPPRKTHSSASLNKLDPSDRLLFEALCTKRKEIAAERKIPTWQFYKIANNRALKQIAVQRPKDTEALLGIEGIGDYLARQFGHHWLSVVKNFSSAMPEKDAAAEDELSDDNGSEGMTSEDETLHISLPPGTEGCLEGKHIVFTGILDMLGRTGASDLATACGARVTEKPDAATNLVVTGRDVSWNKLRYIAQRELETVSEEGFIALVTHKAVETHVAAGHQKPLGTLATLVGAPGPANTQEPEELPPSDRPFHNALRAFRTQLASISKMPAASICSDADLRAIAMAKPPRRANLLRLPGGKGLDEVAQRCDKSVDDFLVRHNRSVPKKRKF
ncbi:3-5 exonuclease helicase [Diplodia corticola]|uniref:3-5 exonuclease helicase n=1 Tax=Diplodia corticola TaxID=236234 RepID=A0A1J9QWG2_9PEZI|nr:3-5 exonuclease helicase [Diplodia corticola]OJD33326.1 3-5 exonuclease helicase [Diplodia corticola]